jgi:hypothetical protein
MTNEELRRYLQMMNREYGQRGWQDTDPVSPLAGEEGWSDIIRDQLRTNQFGDQSLNQSFAEKDLPSGLGLLSNREDAEQVLRSRLVDNPDYPHIKPWQSPTDMMSRDGVPRGELGFASVSQPEEIFPPNSWDSSPHSRSFGGNFPPPSEEPLGLHPFDMPVGGTDNFPVRPSGIETAPFPYSSSRFFEGSPSSGTEGQYINSSGLLASTSEAPVYSEAGLKALGIGSGAEVGLSAAEIASQSEQALISAEAGLEAIEAGADSAWGGPATFAANQALNLIPTRDRDKKVTPFGDEGSVSGILKGTGKGALLGGTLTGGNPWGIAAGGVVGAVGGAQGYFDSTSAPIMNMTRIKRRGGGMQGGLLGGGSMYG